MEGMALPVDYSNGMHTSAMGHTAPSSRASGDAFHSAILSSAPRTSSGFNTRLGETKDMCMGGFARGVCNDRAERVFAQRFFRDRKMPGFGR